MPWLVRSGGGAMLPNATWRSSFGTTTASPTCSYVLDYWHVVNALALYVTWAWCETRHSMRFAAGAERPRHTVRGTARELTNPRRIDHVVPTGARAATPIEIGMHDDDGRHRHSARLKPATENASQQSCSDPRGAKRPAGAAVTLAGNGTRARGLAACLATCWQVLA